MGVETFDITLDSRNSLGFFPGETITGGVHVIVGPTQKCRCKGITVTFEGSTRVQWTEGSGEYSVTYSASKVYFNSAEYLLGTGRIDLVLPSGGYEFPFEFTLPLELPASFAHDVGQVEYKITAKVLRGSWKKDFVATTLLSVNEILNLNNYPLAAEPIECEKYKIPSFLGFSAGPVGFKIAFEKTGFVPGEFLEFVAEIINHSSRRVYGTTAYIFQQVCFHTKKRTIRKKIYICKAKGPEVKRGEKIIWSGNILKIPSLPSSSLSTTRRRIIDIQYFLKIKVKISGISTTLRQYIPIIMGTVPLGSPIHPIQRFPPSDMHTILLPTSFSSGMPSTFENNCPDLHPPSYTEAIAKTPSATPE